MNHLKTFGKAVAVGATALLGANLTSMGVGKTSAPNAVKVASPYLGAGVGAFLAMKLLKVGG